MTHNPFDELGIKKEMVAYLHRQGRLDEVLKGYVRLLNVHTHPDTGDTSDLAARINGAYATIKDSPDRIVDWLSSMQNGVSSDHLVVIEGLVAEIERLQGVDREYEALREKYAQLLVQGSVDADVKKANPRTTGTRRDYEEPCIRTPPRTGASAGATEEPRRPSLEPIVLRDIALYDARGKPVREYKTVTIDAESVKERGSYVIKTQDQWISYFKKTGGVMPSFPLLYAIIERLHTTEHPAAVAILKDCRENWTCTSTRLDYAHDRMIHNFGFADAQTYAMPMPVGERRAHDVIRENDWRAFLHALLMPKDLDQAIEGLKLWSSVPPYIWTASKDTRKSHPERAAFLGALRVGLA